MKRSGAMLGSYVCYRWASCLAGLCKFTLLVFYPLLVLLWVVHRLPEHEATNKHECARQGGMLAAILAVSVLVINWGDVFEGTLTPLTDFRLRWTLFAGCDTIDEANQVRRELGLPELSEDAVEDMSRTGGRVR